MLTLYNVVSADGFIARRDGSEDFIPDDSWQYFLDLCNKYGALIIGRKTYEAIQRYDKPLLELFEHLPIKKIIVTSDRNFYANPEAGYAVAHSPEDAIALAPNALVSSGPILNNYLLATHLVKEIILKVLLVKIHDGIQPFDKDRETLVQITRTN